MRPKDQLSPDRGGRSLFEEQPIRLDGFTLHARGVRPHGRPSKNQWIAAARFACAAEEASPYWIGDLMIYLRERVDWAEAVEQMIGLTGLSLKTLQNHESIARGVGVQARKLAPTFSHAREVITLEPQQQVKLLTTAKLEGWNVPQTAAAVRNIRRPLVLKGQADLAGQYRVILAAPDWSHTKPEQLLRVPVAAHAMADAALFLWAPPRRLPEALDVMAAWRFTYATNAVWDRVVEGSPGRFLNITHEHLLIGTRGELHADVGDFRPRSLLVERRTLDDRHRKPVEVMQWIEKLFTRGPYLALFATERRDGWSSFGRDPAQWAAQARAAAEGP